ncbi:hypothetical protein [Acidisoma sp. L85]|uniref:hypothetical protein n=1 Tax=Acidisoma sp. L85 TaxID=1641850 RepID=UPI00131B1F42|nr:hypothetical protein [Acidisoma sp. L85]
MAAHVLDYLLQRSGKWSPLSNLRYPPFGVVLGLVVALVSLPVFKVEAKDASQVHWPEASKRASVSGKFDGSPIVVSVSSRTAGAIDSLVWKNKEFVDRSDHGREFQSATFYYGKGGCFNPTEAGSNRDGQGPASTSNLLSLVYSGSTLTTKSLMAFWVGPGEAPDKCHGSVSAVKSAVSNDMLTKTITIGVFGIPNAIEYKVNFLVPEARTLGGFEALTGYMPPEFSKFWTYDPVHNELSKLSDGPGKQSLPIIFSTEDQRYAIGVYSPGGEPHRSTPPIYSRFRFTEAARITKTVKWNCYFEEHEVSLGDHAFSCYMVLGDMAEVQAGMRAVCKAAQPARC